MENSKKIAPIGQILVDTGKITQEKLDIALQGQKDMPDMKIGQILSHQGYITDDDVNEALSIQQAIAYLPLEHYKIPNDIAKSFSLNIAERYRCLPVERVDDIMVLVTDKPWDKQVLNALKEYSGCEVRLFFCYANILNEQIKIYSNVMEP